MSKNNVLKFHLPLFIVFLQLVVICGYSCPDTENSYRNDYQDFSELDAQTFHLQDFEFDPLRLNFERERSQSQTEFFKEWLTDNDTFRTTKKTSDFRRDIKNSVKIIINSYQSDFDRRYSRGTNYSEIFQDPRKRSIVKSLKTSKSTDYSYTSFPNLHEIYKYLEVLEYLGEGRATVLPLKHYNDSWNIVHTNFNNEILSIRISSKVDAPEAHEENPIIVVVAGIHGRDWYAIQSAIFLATELIINENRTNIRNFDWWIVPILNPDGYAISQTDSKWRNWEKNLHGTQDVESNECFGLDLDFNFEYQWLICNESMCDSNFPGEVPFIAPEAQGLRDTLEAFGDHVDSFIALKEGRQALVYPFSDSFERPRNNENFEKISMRAVEAFTEHVEEYYDYGQSSYLINSRAGFIEDWAKVHLGIDKSFAFYLGPTTKDRRVLQSQHLMDHMNGTLDLLNVIAHGRIRDETTNSSSRIYLSLLYITINLFIIR